MKDLIGLIIILGLITFGMMVTQRHYYDNEARVNSDWRERTYGQRSTRRTPRESRPARSPRTPRESAPASYRGPAPMVTPSPSATPTPR